MARLLLFSASLFTKCFPPVQFRQKIRGYYVPNRALDVLTLSMFSPHEMGSMIPLYR